MAYHYSVLSGSLPVACLSLYTSLDLLSKVQQENQGLSEVKGLDAPYFEVFSALYEGKEVRVIHDPYFQQARRELKERGIELDANGVELDIYERIRRAKAL